MSLLALLQTADSDDPSWTVAIIVSLVIAAVMFSVGLFTRELAKRGADGRLKKNKLAGIRTKATLASDEAWLVAHQAGEADSVLGANIAAASGVVSIFGAAVLAVLGVVGPEGYMIAWTVILLSGVTLMTVLLLRGTLRGHRAAKALNELAQD